MASIERTAYPRFTKVMNAQELRDRYTLSNEEQNFIASSSRRSSSRLTLAVMLKTRQQMGYFPFLKDIPDLIRVTLAKQLRLSTQTPLLNNTSDKTTIHRHRFSLRSYLSSKPYTRGGKDLLIQVIQEAAETMSDPADLINRALEELIKNNIEIPAFSTLLRLVGHLREEIHQAIFFRVSSQLNSDEKDALNRLLSVQGNESISGFTKLKQSPSTPTITRIRKWIKRQAWLNGLLTTEPLLRMVTHTKIRQFASEAMAYDLSDIKNTNSPKRYTLLICLLYESQAKAKDDLAIMLQRRMKKTENAAKEKLDALHRVHRDIEESLMTGFAKVLEQASQEHICDKRLGHDIRKSLNELGGIEYLQQQYKSVSAYHNNNYIPLMIDIYAKHRSTLFLLLDMLPIRAASQDHSLLEALKFILDNRQGRKEHFKGQICLNFSSDRWKKFIVDKQKNEVLYNRRALEVCVFWYVAEGLKGGDLYIEGSIEFSDPRTQFLSMDECQERIPAYCDALGLPHTPKGIVETLKEKLRTLANQVDKMFPINAGLTLDKEGRPHLKRLAKASSPESLEEFLNEVRERMPEHHLLDILNNTNHWTDFTRHFCPPSGSAPKMVEPNLRYLFTLFGYGCFLGPSQTERHAAGVINRQTLRRINDQHISTEKLEAALRDLINEYARFPLPNFWGLGHAAIADGKYIGLIENNLMGEQHIRYGGYGGIAYHHIADNYTALFCHFIGCGVWEATYILDGLMKNTSDIQPKTLHADTHGQSEPVFALAYLLGIKLFPRMRNWNDVKFYRPSKQQARSQQ